MKSSGRYGVPDWRDERAYDQYVSIDGDDLLWQFLRRHPTFRAAWEASECDRRAGIINDHWYRPFGLLHSSPPDRPSTQEFRHDLVRPPFGASRDSGLDDDLLDWIIGANENGMLIALFDPSLSFEENVRQLREPFEREVDGLELGRIVQTRNRGDWKLLLRILDARDSDDPPRWKPIAEVFCRDKAFLSDRDMQRHYRTAKNFAAKITRFPWPKNAAG